MLISNVGYAINKYKKIPLLVLLISNPVNLLTASCLQAVTLSLAYFKLSLLTWLLSNVTLSLAYFKQVTFYGTKALIFTLSLAYFKHTPEMPVGFPDINS